MKPALITGRLVSAGQAGEAGVAVRQMQFATGAVLPVDGGLSIQRL